MSSGDPTLVGSKALLESMRRDFGKSQEGLQQFYAFFHESQATLHELLRRIGVVFPASYQPFKASPKPMRGRHWICKCCDNSPDCPMLEDEVWYSIAEKSDILCIGCAEKALGRQITIKDLRPCLGNQFTLLMYDRLRTGI